MSIVLVLKAHLGGRGVGHGPLFPRQSFLGGSWGRVRRPLTSASPGLVSPSPVPAHPPASLSAHVFLMFLILFDSEATFIVFLSLLGPTVGNRINGHQKMR